MCAGAVALLCALCAVVASGAGAAEIAPVPFVLGSRYGRSLPRVMTPRNDRFFMGSRYGKRSEPDSLPLLSPPPAPAGPPLACRYTGVSELYRCTRSTVHHPPYGRKSDEENETLEDN